MLKAYMWRMRYRDMLTPDSLYTNLNGLELWAKQTDRPMDRAVLHSLIAEIYSMYAFNNQWQLRQRTEIVGESSFGRYEGVDSKHVCRESENKRKGSNGGFRTIA